MCLLSFLRHVLNDCVLCPTSHPPQCWTSSQHCTRQHTFLHSSLAIRCTRPIHRTLLTLTPSIVYARLPVNTVLRSVMVKFSYRILLRSPIPHPFIQTMDLENFFPNDARICGNVHASLSYAKTGFIVVLYTRGFAFLNSRLKPIILDTG